MQSQEILTQIMSGQDANQNLEQLLASKIQSQLETRKVELAGQIGESQLQELSKSTLSSYADKAVKSFKMLDMNKDMPAASDKQKKLMRKEMDKRQSGVSAAEKRLTK